MTKFNNKSLKEIPKPNLFNIESAILPAGFYDLVFEDAELHYQKNHLAIEYLMQNGFRLMKPSSIEFEASNSEWKQQNSFLFFDPISKKQLSLCSDITRQIVRQIATSANGKLHPTQSPLQICYSGEVFRAESQYPFTDRSQTQIGLEIIYCNQDSANFKVVNTCLGLISAIIASNKKLIECNLLIEFSSPGLLAKLLKSLNIENSHRLQEAIAEKNISLTKAILSEQQLQSRNIDFICRLMLDNRNSAKIITEFLGGKQIDEINNIFNNILEFEKQISLNFVNQQMPKINFAFDPFACSALDYHKDFFFEVFFDDGNCLQSKYPIARGGRYRIVANRTDHQLKFLDNQENQYIEQNIDNVGATIYLNNLLTIFK
jgi:ATP phosphoribosyltransferase regulatory subunit HisZ